MARDTLQLGNIRHCAEAANAAVGCAQRQSEMSRGMAGQRDFKPHVTCWKMQVRLLEDAGPPQTSIWMLKSDRTVASVRAHAMPHSVATPNGGA
jgi:hypothetical protein